MEKQYFGDIRIQKRYIRRVRDLYLEFFEHRSNRFEELRSVQSQSSSALLHDLSRY